MSRKTDAALFARFSDLAGRMGFHIEWIYLVDKGAKKKKLWNAAKIAFYQLKWKYYPHMMKHPPKERIQ